VAVFRGQLDTRTLGGAGFASQCTVDGLTWDLGGWEGLEVDVWWEGGEGGTAGKRYVLLVKDELDVRRMDGRSVSGVTWEWQFTTERTREGGRVRARWDEFKPVYRGKEIPMPDGGLKTREIKRVGVMMRRYVRFVCSALLPSTPSTSLSPLFRQEAAIPISPPPPSPSPASPSPPPLTASSFFNAQSGPFALPIRSIAAIKLRAPPGPAAPPSPQPTHAGAPDATDAAAAPLSACSSLDAEKRRRETEREQRTGIGALTAEMRERGEGTGGWRGYINWIGRV